MPEAISSSLYCTGCRSPLSPAKMNSGNWSLCDRCKAELYVVAFPAMLRPLQPAHTGDVLISDSESGCFYHPQKRAAATCEYCGRFLCALCEIDWNGKRYCAGCIEAGKTKGRFKNLDTRRILYDDVALALTILPVILIFGIYFTFLTAPAAIFIALRYWNAPSSIITRSKARFIIAIILAAIQIIAWLVLIYFLLRSWFN